MPTYTSPVSLSDFQVYLNDTSTDTTLTDFYQSLLEMATEYVYTWLDHDYTASAVKTDVFWGDGSAFYAPRNVIGTITSWHYIEYDGTEVTADAGSLLVRASGYLVQSREAPFIANVEHHLTYQLPDTMTCPETVRQVILEIAKTAFAASNQGNGALGLSSATFLDGASGGSLDRQQYLDLTAPHNERLRPYKRYPV